jgi:DNA-binding CsgD family transcriptional regulator
VHDPVNQVISSEELRALVACLSTALSDLESRVLALYLDGRSYEEIGGRIGCDTKTVDNALQRVKRKVGVHLRVARSSTSSLGRMSALAIVLIVVAVLVVVLFAGGYVANGAPARRRARRALHARAGGRPAPRAAPTRRTRGGSARARAAPPATPTPAATARRRSASRSSRSSTGPDRGGRGRLRRRRRDVRMGRRGGDWAPTQ